MPNLYKMFKTDESLERDGIDLNYDDVTKIKIARAGGSNKRYVRCIERLTRPHRRAIQAESMDSALGRKILIEAYAESVILGWEGVTDEAGNELPFTKENCIKVMTDLPDLFSDIVEQAQKAALFRVSIQEDDAKNS